MNQKNNRISDYFFDGGEGGIYPSNEKCTGIGAGLATRPYMATEGMSEAEGEANEPERFEPSEPYKKQL